MSQTTFTGEQIPIRKKDDPAERKPLTSEVKKKIYNYLRNFYPYGKTEKQIKLHPTFHKIATIGNRLREMRQEGWVESKKQYNGDQTWHAKPPEEVV